ncbi:MAG: hypothetical protein VKK03_05320 [Synechococcus sp.]|nr:hypothetical protein [Synechococcus sp.]
MITASPFLHWHRCRKSDGYGVASGVANQDPTRTNSPYPLGTLEMQAPLFAEQGLDLSMFFLGTLNLSLAPQHLVLQQPDFCFPDLHWTDLHPPETFSFWSIRLRLPERCSEMPGLIYYPHPETKARHWQPPSVIEVLAPWIDDLPVEGWMEIGVDPNRIRVHLPG